MTEKRQKDKRKTGKQERESGEHIDGKRGRQKDKKTELKIIKKHKKQEKTKKDRKAKTDRPKDRNSVHQNIMKNRKKTYMNQDKQSQRQKIDRWAEKLGRESELKTEGNRKTESKNIEDPEKNKKNETQKTERQTDKQK